MHNRKEVQDSYVRSLLIGGQVQSTEKYQFERSVINIILDDLKTTR